MVPDEQMQLIKKLSIADIERAQAYAKDLIQGHRSYVLSHKALRFLAPLAFRIQTINTSKPPTNLAIYSLKTATP